MCKEKILYSLYKQKNGIELTSREISKLSGEISRIKSGKISDVRVSMSNFKNVDGLFEEYEAFKFEHRYIDFDDMLYMARDILETDREIKDRVRNAYGYVQVDEGQDLSEIQLEILKLISQNVFIVGDDDQGIYGFRGAVPEVMIEIEKYFSGCAIYMLKRNYRSTENIVSSADIFIKQNENRYEKEFIAGSYKGRKPKCRMFEDDKELIAFVRSRALSEKYGNLGILYRNGASSVIPAIMCVKYNIPFKLSGKTGVFFESEITGYILEILRFNARKKKFIKKNTGKCIKRLYKRGLL